VQPSTGCDSVGDISELVRSKDLDKVLEDSGLNQIRVKFCYTIDLVGSNNSEEGHSDHLGLRLFDNRHSAQQLTVLRELALDTLEEEEVDLVDDLEMSRKEILEQWNRPLLESLGEDCVVGVSELWVFYQHSFLHRA